MNDEIKQENEQHDPNSKVVAWQFPMEVVSFYVNAAHS
jgi:hypothetical protein